MGAWGVKLYQDDVTEDVRDTYKDRLKRGKTNEELIEELIKENEDILGDEEDAPLVWFALADVQWDYGRLLPKVKEKALEYLESGVDLERWEDEGHKAYEARKKILKELENKLKSEMPPEKKVSQYRIYKCEWEIGDVYAYKLEDDYAKEKGFYGRYVILYKSGNIWWHPGHTVPVIYTKMTQNTELPKTIEDVNNCEFIKDTFGPSGSRYKIRMLSTSKRIIPNRKLTYIGNFENIVTPEDELIKISDDLTWACRWERFDKYVIDNYLKTIDRKNK